MKRSPASRVCTLLLAGSTCVMAQEAIPPLLPPQLPASGPEHPELPRPVEADASEPKANEPDTEAPESPVRRFTPRLPEPRPLSARPKATGDAGSKPERLVHQSDTTVPALEPPRFSGGEPDSRPVFGNEDRTVPPLEGPSPISLEAAPEESLKPYRNSVNPLPSREANPKADRTDPTPSPVQTQPRRRGLFGLFAPRAQPLPRASSVTEKDPSSRTDPATELALKRRIESQVRQVGGRHLRSLDVQVQDTTVTIHARADRFWNRRPLQRAIESLPVLAGHRASVFVD